MEETSATENYAEYSFLDDQQVPASSNVDQNEFANNSNSKAIAQKRKIRTKPPREITSTMSSTSQKHRNFVSEPMGDKPVTELAGIGPTLGGRLSDEGFDKAYVVLGQFLLLKKNEELFMEWIGDVCNANKKQGGDCYQCLKDWCDSFL